MNILILILKSNSDATRFVKRVVNRVAMPTIFVLL